MKKKAKSFCSILLVLCLMFSLLPAAALADETVPGGTGAESDPYIINTLSDLVTVTNNPSAYYKLNADITADTPLTAPLCSSSTPFTGNFDGSNHSVAVSINDTSSGYDGLFAYIGSAGKVSGLTVTGSVTGSTATSYVGGLAAYNQGEINNCTSSVSVTANGTKNNNAGGLVGYNMGTIKYGSAGSSVTANGPANAGGLVGCSYSVNPTNAGGLASLDNCRATGDVTVNAPGSYAGGLVGTNDTGTKAILDPAVYNITNCSASGKVTASSASSASTVGGLVGYGRVVSAQNCAATGNVTAGNACKAGGFWGWTKLGVHILDSHSSGNVTNTDGSGTTFTGGFIGSAESSSETNNCYAKGTVSAASAIQEANIGGFIGKLNTGKIQRSYETGDVSILSSSANFCRIGGMVGWLYSGTIDSCFASGDITASNVTTSNYLNPLIGGFVGSVIGNVPSTISNSYASGDVTLTPMLCGSNLGGFVGGNSNGSYTAVYALGTVKGGFGGFMGGFGGTGTSDCTDVYWNNSKNGGGTGWQESSASGTGLTSDEMSGTAVSSFMTALDFSNVWTKKANNGGHSYAPQLKIFAESSDSTIAADSLSSVELAPDSTIKLDLPGSPSWSGGPTATWWRAVYAGGYVIALYKGNEKIKEVSVDSERFSYDFSSDIANNGSGVYRFTVKAKGTVDGGTTYTDGEVSAPYSPYNYVASLATPVNLRWDDSRPTKAIWDEVSGASSYTVQLYKGGVASGSAVTSVTTTYYDFTSAITEPGSYTFAVTAIGDGKNYANSSASSNTTPYVFTKKLDTPVNLKWDTVTPGKATWDAITGASSYTLQLYKGGAESGSAITGITSTNYDLASVITEPGSYTFAVTAIGDGTFYLTGSESSPSETYVRTTTLGTSGNIKWDTDIPTKAIWDAATNATSYTVQLYRGRVASGSAVTGITGTNYDFTSIITEPGSYTFDVTSVGDGTYYLSGSASAQSAAYVKTATLGTPDNLKWDAVTPGKATWDAVSNASSYTVQLYKGGAASGSAITGITSTNYDFASETMDAGSYTFAVKAIGDGTIYLESAETSASAAYTKTATLTAPTNPKWDTTTQSKAVWDAVTNASSYTVQLYKGGAVSGSALTSTTNYYDFKSAITEPGSYTFTVTAVGDETYYLTGSASSLSEAYILTATLARPANPKWDTTTQSKAVWDAVSNASSYTVQLYKGGAASGSAITGITSTNYDFTSIITEPGSYNFDVTAVGDGMYYLSGSPSTQSVAYVKTATLATPENLKWDMFTPAKAIWEAVNNASSYTVQLYKGGVPVGSAITGIKDNYCGFSSAITEPGSYTFVVNAVGDGTYYLNGSASAQSAAYVKTATLGTPDNLKWDTSMPAKAEWEAVSNASSYTVQLYKGGVVSGSAVTSTTNSYDFTSIITEPGSYTFTVTAVGDGTYYLTGSESSSSTAYGKTATLGTPDNLKWDTVTLAKATWDAVTAAVSYTVQLYKGGVAVGSAITGITSNYYDFASAITETDGYTFRVKSIGDGTLYLDSGISAPSATYNFVANSSISTTSAGFDKKEGSLDNSDISVSLTLRGNNFSGIRSGDAELSSGSDYSVSGNVVTINKTYLASLPLGDTSLTFKFSAGSDQALKITVSDSTPVLISITAPADITNLANGTAKTSSALGLPSTVTLVTSKGNASASVTWDIDACSYNASSTSSQTFTINGAVTLPDGILNTNKVDLKVSISVTVSQAYSPAPIGGGSSVNTSSKAETTGSDGSESKLDVVINGKNASAPMGAEQSAVLKNGGTMTVSIPELQNATGYGVNLPADELSIGTGGTLTLETVLGNISVPTDMLSSLSATSDKTAEITVSQGDCSTLTDDLRSQIGNRPIIQLTLSINGTKSEWNNPDAPVTVSIPYAPTAEEKANPESIVIWYIDGSGRAICIPSGHYDAKTGTVAFTTTHFSQYAVGYSKISFSDVPDNVWFADYVAYLAARGIVGGNNGAFNPDASITRAEFVAILARMSGESLSGYTTASFSDVATDSWYFAAAQWASKAGIASGFGGKFNPDESITREQMTAMLYRYAQYKGAVSNAEGMSVREFGDYSSISSWAQAPIQWAMNNGIISGNPDGGFAPQASATRAQAAKIIYVLINSTLS